MSRALAAVPRPAPEPATWHTLEQEQKRLQLPHPDGLRRLVDLGLPCVDLAITRAGRRKKRNLRFDPVAVDRWLRDRRDGSAS